MKFFSRRVVRPTDLNPANVLFGGTLLSWIDEEVAIFAACQMKSQRVVTKLISEINFIRPSVSGDVVEFGMEVVKVGRTSLTIACVVRNKATQKPIIEISKMVFVALNEKGRPTSHRASLADAKVPTQALSPSIA